MPETISMRQAFCSAAKLASEEFEWVGPVVAQTSDGPIEVRKREIASTALTINITFICPGEATFGDQVEILNAIMERMKSVDLKYQP